MSAHPDALRWRFMLAGLDDRDGPEARALDELARVREDDGRLPSAQMNEMCDKARAAVAANGGAA